MRARFTLLASLGAIIVLRTVACQSSPPPQASEPVEPAQSVGSFSAENAWAHLVALTSIGPRVSGGEGAAQARAYIAGRLSELGLATEERKLTVTLDSGERFEVFNLTAILPGASSDEIVLAAPYDSAHHETFTFVGANEGASGAAVLLELARVIQLHPLPYTTRLVFLDGEARVGRGAPTDENVRSIGSSGLAQTFQHDGTAKRVRLLVVIDRVGDRDLRIARDLRSHRIYREEFWRAASRLGHTDVFQASAGYETFEGGHEAFINSGLRKVVALSDTSHGGDESPGPYAHTEDDSLENCSPESLAIVGSVMLEALDAIGARLAKIDRFSQEPLADVTPETTPVATEEPEEGEPGDGEDAAEAEPAEAPATDAVPGPIGEPAAGTQPAPEVPAPAVPPADPPPAEPAPGAAP